MAQALGCATTPVKDRFTVDFEKVFFFAKSPKYDFRQQFEPYAGNETNRISGQPEHPTGSKSRNDLQGRNKRAVWRITTEISHEKHYAPYPQKLIETPIEAGCPPGGVVLDPVLGKRNDGPRRPQAGTPLHRHREPNPEYVAIARSRLERGPETTSKQ
ncbi:DNA methyltransferase [Alistipes putredinis]|uniref:DNA methyltransferase n=1 Tax=Alistipes putredinis TaxID=28117 RepID=UPI003996A7DD